MRQTKNTKSKAIIAPSLLAADPANYAAEINEVERGGAHWLHVDVMDGKFVPPITFGDNIVAMAKRCSKLFLDVHLMVENPDVHLDTFHKAGANRSIVHQEACPHLYRTLSKIQSLGIAAGVAINPGTPIGTVLDVLSVCDLVLVMTVNPGWGGQKFISDCLVKISELKKEIDRRAQSKQGKKRTEQVHIEVDGGITPETALLCARAGADAFVAGSSIFGEKNRAAAIAAIRNALR